MVGERLAQEGRPLLVIEDREDAIAAARRDGARIVAGNADPEVLASTGLATARRLFVTIPEAFEAGQVVQQARAASPGLEILARAHSEDALRHLDRLGATLTILGEREIAHRMLEQTLPPG